MTLTRRQFLGTSLLGVAALGGAEAFLREPAHPVGEPVQIYLEGLPESFDGFRIAQLSDIHFGPYMGKAGVERALKIAESFQPDLITLTGDFVSHPFGKSNGIEGAHFAEPCADVLATRKQFPMLAILGNHDHWNSAAFVAGALHDRGIRVLRNQSHVIEHGQQRLWFAGVDDVFEEATDLPQALKEVPASEAAILLAHEPDFADYASRYPVDLQLSGHSHGGQVRVPGFGPIVLPTLGRKYHTGLNRAGRLQVYTSRGLGVINPPVRFNCLPEVTLLTLHQRLPGVNRGISFRYPYFQPSVKSQKFLPGSSTRRTK